MSAALRLYEQLTEAKDDKTRARLIAEAFDALEARFPQRTDLATHGHVRESELRLQKEIKVIEGQIKETEERLQKKIKSVRFQGRNRHQAIICNIKPSGLRRQYTEMVATDTIAEH